MKVGDLVTWLHPEALDYGIVIKLGGDYFAGEAYVEWQGTPQHSGYYPIDHELLQVVNEAG